MQSLSSLVSKILENNNLRDFSAQIFEQHKIYVSDNYGS